MRTVKYENLRPGFTDIIAKESGVPKFVIDSADCPPVGRIDINQYPEARRIYRRLAEEAGVEMSEIGFPEVEPDQMGNQE